MQKLRDKNYLKATVELNRKHTHAIKLIKDMGFTIQSAYPRKGGTGKRNMTLLFKKN
jgi:hypothetical protein